MKKQKQSSVFTAQNLLFGSNFKLLCESEADQLFELLENRDSVHLKRFLKDLLQEKRIYPIKPHSDDDPLQFFADLKAGNLVREVATPTTPKTRARKGKKEEEDGVQAISCWKYLTDGPEREFDPNFDLFDACTIDYYLAFLTWTHGFWLMKIAHEKIDPETGIYERLLSNKSDISQQSSSYLACSFILAHGLLEHLQLVQLLIPDKDQQKKRLFLTLKYFQTTFNATEVDELIPLNQEFLALDSVDQALLSSEHRLSGILGNLQTDTLTFLIDFVMRFFFGNFQLFELVFGPCTGIEREIVVKKLELDIPIMPQSELWPPPFCESVPTDLLKRYSDRFPAYSDILAKMTHEMQDDCLNFDLPGQEKTAKEEEETYEKMQLEEEAGEEEAQMIEDLETVPIYVEHLKAKLRQLAPQDLEEIRDIEDQDLQDIIRQLLFKCCVDDRVDYDQKFEHVKVELVECFRETLATDQ
ncbi:hypothetical protein Ciccas_012121 [Cichlidogyrus casuarinus]|uniref:Uncharacterized protein n=1 Tax=Cichlidogyrus casuarinus TaxID=1844966 RepID=A0ABD2PPC5_9PLAT